MKQTYRTNGKQYHHVTLYGTSQNYEPKILQNICIYTETENKSSNLTIRQSSIYNAVKVHCHKQVEKTININLMIKVQLK